MSPVQLAVEKKYSYIIGLFINSKATLDENILKQISYIAIKENNNELSEQVIHQLIM